MPYTARYTKHVNVLVGEDIRERLDTLVEQRAVSQAEVIRRALTAGLAPGRTGSASKAERSLASDPEPRRSAGRKKQINILVTQDTDTEIVRLNGAFGVGRSEVIRRAVAAGFDNAEASVAKDYPLVPVETETVSEG